MRIGHGYDIHRFGTTRPLVLGGVQIPHARGLIAHSDGDALLHALCDALLGACALGDIGTHFSPDDPQWRNADSAELLSQVYHKVRAAGWQVENMDATLLVQEPPLAAHTPAMRTRLAQLLALPEENIGVKARSNEGMDAVGSGKALAAHVVVLLRASPAAP